MPVAGDGTHIGNHVPTCGQAVIPDRDRAVIVLPENVALMVGVEVADAGNMPTGWHRGGDGVPTGWQAVIPDRDRAVVVLPENVDLDVAVEVDGAGKMVSGWHHSGNGMRKAHR